MVLPVFFIARGSDIQELINAWGNFLKNTIWQDLIDTSVPKSSGCGLVYELPNFLNRPDEDFAICDMRQITFSEPHYHPHNVFEIYFVLQGTALIVIDGQEQSVRKGNVIIIPPAKAHFTIPDNQFVIGIVNTPPYKPDHYIALTESNDSVGFDYEQFTKLNQRMNSSQN